MLSLLKKGPSANKVPAEKIQATYGRYRMQALLSVFLGYLAYYIVRNNFTLSTPYLKEQLDLSATQIGLLSSCMLIAYGISKGVMSSLADKASPKVFMACGLVLCAIVNVGLGFNIVPPDAIDLHCTGHNDPLSPPEDLLHVSRCHPGAHQER